VLRQQRIPLARVDQLSVFFSRGWHFGWRIGVHHADAHVDTFADVAFVAAPRTEPYGRIAVFLDIAGNKWDLLGAA
jgi:hypothetical protein